MAFIFSFQDGIFQLAPWGWLLLALFVGPSVYINNKR